LIVVLLKYLVKGLTEQRCLIARHGLGQPRQALQLRCMLTAETLWPEEVGEIDMTEANARWAGACLNHEGHIRTRIVQTDEGWAVAVYDDEDDELLFVITAIQMGGVPPEQPEA
jgi:hypothetical protein